MSPSHVHRPAQVFKFGGTSVQTARRIRRVVEFVRTGKGDFQRIVVVSALGGVTDSLIGAIDDALGRTKSHRSQVNALRERHVAVAKELAPDHERSDLIRQLDECWQELANLLDGVGLLGECTPRTRDAILSVGERACAPLVASAFRGAGEDAIAVDARDIIRTDHAYGEANVQFDETVRLVAAALANLPSRRIVVVTGFVAGTGDGETTTLGRSGSDYTATIIGRALRAERVEIWTDVDGVLSADPRDVPEAFTLSRLSYTEAAEMAYFGARVLHPRTMRPVQEQGIPLLIKNSLNPDAPGTLISAESHSVELRVKAISTIRDVAVVMLEGGGMLGVPGIAARAFTTLAEVGVNVLMIAQASSEHSICTVVREQSADAAVAALRQAFSPELERGDVSTIFAVPQCAVVSAVGDRMRHHPGLAGRMFATLGRSRVNVLSIAQGAAETNISAVVRDAEVRRSVRALHEAFPLARLRAHVCLIGTGRVGASLVRIIGEQYEQLLNSVRLNLRLVGLANSRRMVWSAEAFPFGSALGELENGMPTNLEWLLEQVGASRLERLIVVDATASESLATKYPDLLDLGVGIVTANKLANTQGMAFYRRLQQATRQREVAYRYETTVGAGLPVLSTLQDLIRSGDAPYRIEGILSGTLAYVFNQLEAGEPLSAIVRRAHELGYTEPDPFTDLRGNDVARKLLILARELGLEVERRDIDVEPVIPAEFPAAGLEESLSALEALDGHWKERVDAASAAGMCLRYVATLVDGELGVGVREVPVESALGRLAPRENVVSFYTERYHDMPLVVRGPGAGPAVTAGGIIADLIKAAELMQ